MLLENQLKAIREQMNTGGPLPQDMASALLAAYESSEQNRKNNVEQIDQLTTDKNRLIFERDNVKVLTDEATKAKAEIEETVERRARALTEVLRESRDHNIRRNDAWKEEYVRLDGEHKEALLLITRLRQELELQMPQGWLTKWWRQRCAKRVLRDVERKFPTLDERVNAIQSERENQENQRPETDRCLSTDVARTPLGDPISTRTGGIVNRYHDAPPEPVKSPSRWRKDW